MQKTEKVLFERRKMGKKVINFFFKNYRSMMSGELVA